MSDMENSVVCGNAHQLRPASLATHQYTRGRHMRHFLIFDFLMVHTWLNLGLANPGGLMGIVHEGREKGRLIFRPAPDAVCNAN